jgi:hypothetical protein
VHVLVVPEDLAVQRVRHRVRAGGHDVPEAKIRQRHRRLWALVAEAIALSDIATVYDNSRLRGPRIVAQLSGGCHHRLPRLAGVGAGGAAITPAELTCARGIFRASTHACGSENDSCGEIHEASTVGALHAVVLPLSTLLG